jgi:hypothetical protein
MFTKCSCQHCNGHIEFDNSNDGLSVKCPHCFEITKLVAPPAEPIAETTAQPQTGNNFRNSFMGDEWKSDPMSEKQKAMLILYGVIFKEGLTKGEAAQLIDNAINTGAKPSVESQAKAGEVWGNYRLTKVVEEMTKAVEIISDETATIKTLKETKKKLKESVQNFTELIDRRIDTVQNANREIRNEKTSEWLKERGF